MTYKNIQNHRKRTSQAFTLIEVVVAAALVALIGSIVASLFGVATRSTTSTTAATNTLSSIDSNISNIKQIAETLTCCPGSCTTNASTITTAFNNGKCGGVTSGQSSYYWPLQSGDIATFTTACNATASTGGAIETAMLTAINALSQPSGATRTASVDETTAHRIIVTFTGTTEAGGSFVNRTIKIVPTVASFCP